jgi:molybdopterin-guanine dinucleotide biosynthesis protein A
MNSMLTGILLAGGKSKRMRQNKAFLKFRGRHLYEFPLEILQIYCDEILISTSDSAFRETNHILVSDEFPEMGPMGGIYSCMKKARYNFSLVLPCDLPLLERHIIDIMLQNYMQFDITVVLNNDNLPEPIIGIYSRNLIPLMEKSLKSGKLKLQELLLNSNTLYIDLKNEGYVITAHSFRNINNVKDYNELILKYG